MIYLLTLILIALILTWVLTLHYQAKVVELQMKIAEKESDRIADIGVLSQEYESRIKDLESENTMLRRRLR